MSNWLNNAVIALVTPIFIDNLKGWMYLIFGTMGLIMGMFVYFFVPETMGKSLEQMDDVFGEPEGGSKADRAEFRLRKIALVAGKEETTTIN